MKKLVIIVLLLYLLLVPLPVCVLEQAANGNISTDSYAYKVASEYNRAISTISFKLKLDKQEATETITMTSIALCKQMGIDLENKYNDRSVIGQFRKTLMQQMQNQLDEATDIIDENF